jgi:SAM-dependent methyltransferase
VTGTMTWAAMDVHARSTYAASMDVITGEVSRQRFDTGAVEPVVGWLAGLPGPVRCCYEAGPTGFGLYRAAVAAGVECQVIAPSKTPRPSGDRHKSDRRDTDLLLRQLMAGALTAVAVPSPTCEAARDLARAREQVRLDLMRCRHRLSKLLLRHGRVWDRSAWTKVHREWLGAQVFEQTNTELAFIDNLAACDGLTARRQALDERLSHVATDPEFWPLVSRLRAFRGIDTVDMDPVMLAIGQGALGTVGGRLRWIQADLASSDWLRTLGDARIDAVLSATALHWLEPEPLARLYHELGRLLPTGGVFLNGDHLDFGFGTPTLQRLSERALDDQWSDAAFAARGIETAEQWWEAAAREPGLAPLVRERMALLATKHRPASTPDFSAHVAALRKAGFREVGGIWQVLSDRVLLAVR